MNSNFNSAVVVGEQLSQKSLIMGAREIAYLDPVKGQIQMLTCV